MDSAYLKTHKKHFYLHEDDDDVAETVKICEPNNKW